MEIFRNQQLFQVHVLCEAATKACLLTHGIYLDHRKTFFVNRSSTFESSRTPYKGLLHSTTPCATRAVPVHVCTGTPVARGEERIGSTIPVPTLAGRPSTMNSFLPVDIPQSSMVGQQRFDKFTTPSTFSCWKMRFKNQVSSCSDFPWEAMLWIKDVEMVDSVEE